MAITLRKECLDKLRPLIARAINGATVSAGSLSDVMAFIVGLWSTDEALPKRGEAIDQLTRYCGDRIVMPFVLEYVRNRIDAAKIDRETPSQKVTEALGIDADSLADEVLGALQSLPWHYVFTLPLPPKLSEFVEEVGLDRKVGQLIRLTPINDEFRKHFGIVLPTRQTGLFGLLAAGGGLPTMLPGEGAVLQVGEEGFVSLGGSGAAFDEAHAVMRSFFGLGLALGLFEMDYVPSPHPSTYVFIHSFSEQQEEAKPHSQVSLSASELNALARIRFCASSKDWKPQMKCVHAENLLEEMAVIFSHADAHEKLLRACRWFFDSYISEDPLLSFVQAMVVLEIILGHTPKMPKTSDSTPVADVSLGKLLANRCAYMIGKSTTDRDNILTSFGKIYATRSKIVHRGERLSKDEKDQLRHLRWIGGRVVRAEVDLALADHRRIESAATP